MRMRPTLRAVAVCLLAVAGACAPAGAGPAPSGNLKEITSEQVRAASQHNAYELVHALRPDWLRKRTSAVGISRANTRIVRGDDYVTAYRDGQRLGPVEALRNIPIMDVGSVRHYDAPAAQQRFGSGNSNGAVEVITRRGGS